MKLPSLSGLFHKVENAVEDYFGKVHVWSDPSLPVPPDRGELKMVSFNIERGGSHLTATEAELRKLDPDVVCLQECSPESAQKLGKALGMNVVYQQRTDPHNRVNGKAILTRYPVVSTENIQFGGSWAERKAAKARLHGEAGEARSLLRASIRVGNRTVDVVDTHLSLVNTKANADELGALADYAKKREGLGHTVLLAGDFNSNLALAGNGAADPKGANATPTDTLDEFHARYPTAVTGNIGDARDRAQANRLRNVLGDYWAAPNRTLIVEGKPMTPEAAAEALKTATPGTAHYLALRQAVDGISHLTAHKRFDNIFASKDVHITSAEIDQTVHASDHQPVMATVEWDEP